MAKKYIITADDVIDNLTSDLEDVPLSANQGRVLKGLVDGKASSSHNHAASDITSGTLDSARLPAATASALGGIKVGTGLSVSNGTVSVSYGSASDTACQGNDSRLSDSRTPTSHASTHKSGGSDALYSTATVTLTTSGWSSKSQTVSVSGVTTSNTVIVAPAPASIDVWGVAGCKCSAQASGALTFVCEEVPTENITVNVMVML